MRMGSGKIIRSLALLCAAIVLGITPSDTAVAGRNPDLEAGFCPVTDWFPDPIPYYGSRALSRCPIINNVAMAACLVSEFVDNIPDWVQDFTMDFPKAPHNFNAVWNPVAPYLNQCDKNGPVGVVDVSHYFWLDPEPKKYDDWGVFPLFNPFTLEPFAGATTHWTTWAPTPEVTNWCFGDGMGAVSNLEAPVCNVYEFSSHGQAKKTPAQDPGFEVIVETFWEADVDWLDVCCCVYVPLPIPYPCGVGQYEFPYAACDEPVVPIKQVQSVLIPNDIDIAAAALDPPEAFTCDEVPPPPEPRPTPTEPPTLYETCECSDNWLFTDTLDCSDFARQESAQLCLETCDGDQHDLDSDDDGWACCPGGPPNC